MERYQCTLRFTEPLLGTTPKDREVYQTYIQGKAADLGDNDAAQELATVENVEQKGWTGFHTMQTGPILYDYVIKGFLKRACQSSRMMEDTRSGKLTSYRDKITNLVFVFPRQIPLILPAGEGLGILERPLRAETAQGPRVALARSDTCPVGTELRFEIHVLGTITETHLREWLDFGQYYGLGQWRSGGYGRFSYMLERMA